MATKRQASYQNVTVSLSRIRLDPQNPRHDEIEDEPDIIAELYAKERVLALAEDIVRRGGALSPIERVALIPVDGLPEHYYMAEGNRRLCALKLLLDPEKAPTSEARTKFKALAKRTKIDTKIEAVLFKDRDTAQPWVDLRHHGAQDGAGTRAWNAVQKARAETGSPNSLALAVMDRGVNAGWITDQQRVSLAITTLRRYLATPSVRQVLGLGDPKDMVFTHAAAEVDIALKAFLRDALPVPGSSEPPLVHSRSDATERKNYAKDLARRGLAVQTPLGKPIDPPPPTKKPTKARPPRQIDPAKRVHLIPNDVDFRRGDTAVNYMVGEIRRLRTDDFPLAANYLLRAVLERVMVQYAKKRKIWRQGLTDHALTDACARQLEQDGVHQRQLQSMRSAASNTAASHSMTALGAGVHGGHQPSLRDLNGIWDNWSFAVQNMLAAL